MMPRRLLIAVLLTITLAIGFGISARAEETAQQRLNSCLNSKGHIVPSHLAPCLDPTPGDKDKEQDFKWITETWKWSLSVVNVFAAFVLIFMAFANILYPWQALEPFRIRQLLPTFIWGIILANASLFICRAVVSIADMLMSNSGLQINLADLYVNWSFEPGLLPLGVIPAMFGKKLESDIFGLAYQLVVSTIFIYLPLVGLIILSFVFYFRTALIFFLTAISPLAFASIIFPATRGYLSRWWDAFWKWTFGGVGSWLLIYLAAQIPPAPTKDASLTIHILPYLITAALIYMAIIAPFRLGAVAMNLVENFGRRLWGMGSGMAIGATKFGYHYAEVGAAKKLVNTEDKINKAIKEHGEGSAQHKAALRNLAWAKMIHGVVRSPSIIRSAFNTRKAHEEKLLGKTAMKSGLFESIAGREAAMAAKQEDFAFITSLPDIAQQIDILQGIKKKYNVDDAWLYDLYTSKLSKAAKMSLEKGMSTEEALKARAAIAGYFTNARYLRAGQADPTALLGVGLAASTPAAGAQAVLDYLREQAKKGGDLNATATPAGAAVAAAEKSNFSPILAGADIGHSLETAVNQLKGIHSGLQTVPATVLTNAIRNSMSNGRLDRALFRKALAPHFDINSLAPDISQQMETALSEYEKQARRLSSRPVDINVARQAKLDWALDFEKNPDNAGKDMLQELRNKEKLLEQALDEIKGDGAQTLDANDQEVIVRHGLKFKFQFDQMKTKDDLRHAIQHELVGNRSILADIEAMERAAAQSFENKIKSNPEEIKISARKAFNLIFQRTKGQPAQSPRFEEFETGVTNMKNRILTNLLREIARANTQAQQSLLSMLEGIGALERILIVGRERGKEAAEELLDRLAAEAAGMPIS